MIDSNLYTVLAADSGVSAIVSDRIYPRNAMPSAPTYELVTFDAEAHEYTNTFTGNSGFVRSDYIVDAWGETIDEASVLSTAIRSALKNVTGSFGGISVSQVFITSGPITVYEESVEAYRMSQIFSIWHNQG